MLILIGFITWYIIGFIFTYLAVRVSWIYNDTLDSADMVFVYFFSCFGPCCGVILMLESFANKGKLKIVIKDIYNKIFNRPKKELTLKQKRLKKLKRIKWRKILIRI